jgi:hypothetical protein
VVKSISKNNVYNYKMAVEGKRIDQLNAAVDGSLSLTNEIAISKGTGVNDTYKATLLQIKTLIEGVSGKLVSEFNITGGDLIVSYTDLTSQNLGAVVGADGDNGVGISSVVENVNTSLTFTFTDTSEFTTSELKGDKGETSNFKTITALKLANGLLVGDFARTYEYLNGQSGGALYRAVASGTYTDGVDGQSVDGSFLVGVGVQWELFSTTLSPEMFGTVGNGIVDDTLNLQKSLDFSSLKRLKVFSDSSKNYFVNRAIQFKDYAYFDAGGCQISAELISNGGSYSAINTLIIVGVESGAFSISPTLKNIFIDFEAHNNDLPTQGISIYRASNALVEGCEVRFAAGSCFNIFRTNDAIIRGNIARSPYFHGFGSSQLSFNSLYEYNKCYDIVSDFVDNYAFDINCPDVGEDVSTVRFNYVDTASRFIKGQSQPLNIHNNIIKNIGNTDGDAAVVIGNNGVNFRDNEMYNIDVPFLFGSVGTVPTVAKESIISGNYIFNNTVELRELIQVGVPQTGVKGFLFSNNTIRSTVNNAAVAPIINIDQSTEISFLNNEISLEGTFANTTLILISAAERIVFDGNLIESNANRQIFISGTIDELVIQNNFIRGLGVFDSSLWLSTNALGRTFITGNTIESGQIRVTNSTNLKMSNNNSQYEASTPNPDLTLSGSGTPIGSVTPRKLGDDYLDTVANKFYKSNGLTNSDWLILN